MLSVILIWGRSSGRHLKNLIMFNTKMLEMDHQDGCKLNNWSIFDSFLTKITGWTEPLIFYCQQLTWNKFLQEIWTLPAMGIDTMSCFSSLTAEQKQQLHTKIVLKVLESKSSVVIDVPFSSSKTTCRISATSCWESKSKGALWRDEILCLKAHRKFER